MGGDLSSSLHPFCLSPQAQPRHLGPALRDSFPREAPAKLWVWPFSGPHHTSQHCLLLALLVPICSFASWGLFLDLCCFFCACHSVFLNGTSLPSLFPWTNLSPERNFWPESLVPWQAAWGIFSPLLCLPLPDNSLQAEFIPQPLERLGRKQHFQRIVYSGIYAAPASTSTIHLTIGLSSPWPGHQATDMWTIGTLSLIVLSFLSSRVLCSLPLVRASLCSLGAPNPPPSTPKCWDCEHAPPSPMCYGPNPGFHEC